MAKSKRIYKRGKKSRKTRGRGEFYTAVGDSDRDSVDSAMEETLGKLGISNAPEGEQKGWLAVSIGGILAVGGIGYLIIKGR